jgi:hypothetical protein
MAAKMIWNEVGGTSVLAPVLACGKLLSSPPEGPIRHKPNKMRQK